MQVTVDYDGKNKISGCAYFQGCYFSLKYLAENCNESLSQGCTYYAPLEEVPYWFEVDCKDEEIRCSSFEAAKWLLEKSGLE